MRVALFSDVHGNAVAFRAMLDDLARQDYDQAVCLGDHAQGGPQPAESLELLRDLGAPAMMGNSDHFLLTLDFGEEEVIVVQIENAKWAKAQLSDDLVAFHRSFRPTVEIELGGGRTLLAFHASPRSREERVDPWTDDEGNTVRRAERSRLRRRPHAPAVGSADRRLVLREPWQRRAPGRSPPVGADARRDERRVRAPDGRRHRRGRRVPARRLRR